MDKAIVPKADILIVDDTPLNLRLLSQMLRQQDYRVRVAEDGLRALESVHANPPDLVLLDVMMPGMNGYEVCQQLKANEALCDIPVIFLSALGQTDDKIKAFEAGGVDYITKPFQIKEVLARVQTHLMLQQLQHRLAQQVTELTERNEELDAFAHTVAHDLKNPLANLIGYAGVLVMDYNTMPSEQVGKLLNIIAHTGNKMNNILDELLLLASVRRVDVRPQPINMGRVVAEACQRLQGVFQEYHAELVMPDTSTWPVALGYAPWVEEVWVNYLSNGCKYGGVPPRIELGWDWVKDKGRKMKAEGGKQNVSHGGDISSLIPHPSSFLRFWVRDNGAGLSPEQQSRLFVPFTRLEQVRAKGYGLGLSIVHRIVEKLGGQVSVESEGVPGRGSTFYFTLPAADDMS